MIQKRKFRCLYVLLFLLPLSVCLALGMIYIYRIHNQGLVENKILLDEISKRTGLSPDWLAVRTYVYCDLSKPGTPRDQIEQGLSLIGQFKSPNSEDLVQQINFADPSLYYNLSPLILRYDKKWYLVSSGAGEFNHGPMAQCEVERAETAAASIPTSPAK